MEFNNTNKDVVYTKSSQYLVFTTSDLKQDLGQHTLPFLEIAGVHHLPSVPLSSAGIILKSRGSFGHFLGFKVFTYDIEPYL